MKGYLRLAICLVVLASLTVIGTPSDFIVRASALPDAPAPSSDLVGQFTWEVDNQFGYQILRPATWESMDLGDMRAYLPPDSTGKADRVMLGVSNMLKGSNSLPSNTYMAGMRGFEQKGTLAAWQKEREALWHSLGISFYLLQQSSNSAIYVVEWAPNQLQLIAHVVDKGQPLIVVLYGFGFFSNVGELTKAGLLTDFQTMVASVTASTTTYGARSGDAITGATVNNTGPDLIQAISPKYAEPSYGPECAVWGGDGQCNMSGYLKTGWQFYPGNGEVERLYEQVYWRYYSVRTEMLFRTNVGDDPDGGGYTLCVDGGGYINHPTGKWMDSTTGAYATDDYWPYYTDSRIGTQTYHLVAYGDPVTTYCTQYQPFY